MSRAQQTALGPDLCQIQTWGARALAKAQGRDPELGEYDRVAWNLAQARMATAIERNPNIEEDHAVALVETELAAIYAATKPPTCAYLDTALDGAH